MTFPKSHRSLLDRDWESSFPTYTVDLCLPSESVNRLYIAQYAPRNRKRLFDLGIEIELPADNDLKNYQTAIRTHILVLRQVRVCLCFG